MLRESASVVIFSVGLVGLAFVVGTNLYEQVFCIPSWRTPEGIRAWRTLTEHRNAGVFFLPAAGGGWLCLAIGTALGWNHPAARNPYALAATAAMLAALVLTGAFFVPLNMRLFVRPSHDEWPVISGLVDRWVWVNFVRVALGIVALVAALVALRK